MYAKLAVCAHLRIPHNQISQRQLYFYANRMFNERAPAIFHTGVIDTLNCLFTDALRHRQTTISGESRAKKM